jgi:hypothetical protein
VRTGVCAAIGGAASHQSVATIQVAQFPEQIGPVRGGPAQRHIPAPARDRRVVAGQQHLGYLALPPGPRPGEDRALEQPAHGACGVAVTAERVVVGRGRVA